MGSFWRHVRELYSGWARGRLDDPATGAAELRPGPRPHTRDKETSCTRRSSKVCSPNSKPRTLGAESALARIDEALALARQTGTTLDLTPSCIASAATSC